MRAFLDEIRTAVSGLARAPAFTALAIGVLGLGLAAVIFMFGVANTMMLKAAPLPGGDRLYTIATYGRESATSYEQDMWPADYLKVREVQTQFEAMGSIYIGTAYLAGDGQVEFYYGGFADGFIFDVAGVNPIVGRAIEPRDASEGAAPVVVLSHELWSERFDADPGAIGRIVRVNGKPSEVIGVMPEGFTFPRNAKFWVAIQEDATRMPRQQPSRVQVIGRLKPGGNPDVAQQELAPVAARIRSEVGPEVFLARFEVEPFAAAAGYLGDQGRRLIWTLLVAVGFVLLIACANVSNLLLARSAYRVRETTVRAALGASRGRLVAHMLAEGVVVSALATLLGLLLASIALDGIQLAVALMQEDNPSWWTFEIDYRVVAVAVLAAFLSTMVAGVPAAIRASRPSLDSLLRDGGRSGTGLAIGKIAWGLVVFEVALACLLLGVSALMAKGALRATSGDLGVETGDIMTARVGVTAGTYVEEADRVRFWEQFLARIESQPGIDAATVTGSLPGHIGAEGPVSVEGRDYSDAAPRPVVQFVPTSPSVFETFRVSALQGRLLDSRDRADSLPTVVINQTMARRMFPDESPLGKRIRIDERQKGVWMTVVGVVPDVAYGQEGLGQPVLFAPMSQISLRYMSIAVRGKGDPRALIAQVRTALAETDPDLALYWVRTLEEGRVIATARIRIIGIMFAVFAGVALVLAAAGLFGVLAFHVGQRTRELGVRRALGADNRQILGLIMRTSGAQILIGVGIGMALLPPIGRGLGDLLNEVSPYDPGVYAFVIAVMTAVAIVATLMPTRRALQVDPAVALRYE